MLIYKKYIAKSILYPFLVLGVVLTGLVWITQILKLMYLIDRGVGLTDFFRLTILILPSLFFVISPLICVLSTIFVYYKLQEDRELIIFKASGLGNFSLIKPALTFATIVTLFGYYISSYLMPLSYNKLKSELRNFRENYLSRIIDEKKFNQISKNITVYIDKRNPDSTLEGIILFDNEVPENRSVLFARNGKIFVQDNALLFQLQDGFRQIFDENNNLNSLYFDSLLMEVKKNNINNNDRSRTSLELYINEMLWPNETISEERKMRLIIDGHQRLLWPLFNYCLVFLALATFLNQPYNRRSHFKQMLYTFIPLVLVSYIHFSGLQIAYQNRNYIGVCYLNIILCLIFSVWQSRRKL